MSPSIKFKTEQTIHITQPFDHSEKDIFFVKKENLFSKKCPLICLKKFLDMFCASEIFWLENNILTGNNPEKHVNQWVLEVQILIIIGKDD